MPCRLFTTKLCRGTNTDLLSSILLGMHYGEIGIKNAIKNLLSWKCIWNYHLAHGSIFPCINVLTEISTVAATRKATPRRLIGRVRTNTVWCVLLNRELSPCFPQRQKIIALTGVGGGGGVCVCVCVYEGGGGGGGSKRLHISKISPDIKQPREIYKVNHLVLYGMHYQTSGINKK